ncbi:GrpB family protein [Rhizobium sp. BR 249]|uniref:GrpB family protein n=1 Tax=Rhizobium sp. BR 249 TaxID=3040011 RepID=UPI0039BF33F7
MQQEQDESFGLGVRHLTVRLSDPNAKWREAYLLEEARIRNALAPLALDIQHFGSTAIPGIKAKPIIDIMIGVPRFEDGLACVKPMEEIGYDYAGTDMVPDDHLFGRGITGETRTHLAHVVEYRGFNWRRNIFFRDRLQNDPALALAYEELKIGLAQKFAESRAAYTGAKKDFIDKVLAEGGLA